MNHIRFVTRSINRIGSGGKVRVVVGYSLDVNIGGSVFSVFSEKVPVDNNENLYTKLAPTDCDFGPETCECDPRVGRKDTTLQLLPSCITGPRMVLGPRVYGSSRA